ncbi:MAG TPA: MBL fold metallo-hydrolase [Dissulfurispiraceae bacterium]
MAVIEKLAFPGLADISALKHGSIFFVGAATTVIRYGGFTILTDPNFLHAGDHAHMGYGITSKRKTNPAMEIGDLPPLDLCVLSHMHGDHWDKMAEARLAKSLPIVTTLEASLTLRRRGFDNLHPLNHWDSIDITKGEVKLRIASMPGKHGPGLVNALLPQVMGSMMEWRIHDVPVFHLYISGDTLVHKELEDLSRRYTDIDLALLHLGGARILGILVTMDAQQGIQAIRIIRPRMSIPIHYNDYPVFKSPLEEFMQAAKEAGIEDKVHYLKHGDTYEFEVARASEHEPVKTR